MQAANTQAGDTREQYLLYLYLTQTRIRKIC